MHLLDPFAYAQDDKRQQFFHSPQIKLVSYCRTALRVRLGRKEITFFSGALELMVKINPLRKKTHLRGVEGLHLGGGTHKTKIAVPPVAQAL